MKGYTNKSHYLYFLFSLFLLLFPFYGCSVSKPGNQAEVNGLSQTVVPPAPDYSETASWIAADASGKHKADVFYVYPTIFASHDMPVYMDTVDEKLRSAAKTYSLFNMGIFGDVADFFAPYYRQASLETFTMLSEGQINSFLSVPYSDTLRAFDYYMSHFNKGRPFFLAGFSQGGMAVIEIIEKRLNDPEIAEKFVASYIFGASVTDKDIAKYPWLKPADNEAGAGVFVAFNTQKPGGAFTSVLKPGSLSINPVSWKRDNEPADMKDYKGAVIITDFATGRTKPDYKPFSSVYLEKGTNALAVENVNEIYSANALKIFGGYSLHTYDPMFFYNNIKENAAKRLDTKLRGFR